MGEGNHSLANGSVELPPATGERPPTEAASDPATEAERLEQKASAIRENVRELVGELDHRRHRAVRTYLRPVLIGAAIAGVGALIAVVWRSVQRRPSRVTRVGLALRRAAEHPERVAASPGPSVGKRAANAGIGLGSLIVARLIKRHLRP